MNPDEYEVKRTDRELWIQAMSDVQDRVYQLTLDRFNSLKRMQGDTVQYAQEDLTEWVKNHLISTRRQDFDGTYRYQFIQTIKELRAKTGWSLKESKDFVDNVRNNHGLF